jgi:hypothetical protein
MYIKVLLNCDCTVHCSAVNPKLRCNVLTDFFKTKQTLRPRFEVLS